MTQDIPLPEEDDLTVGQLQILEMIKEEPEASQKDFADRLDISASAVSNRLRDIPGFSWKNRDEFVKAFYNGDVEDDGAEQESEEQEDPTEEKQEVEPESSPDEIPEALTDPLDEIRETLSSLSEQVDRLRREGGESGVTDPDLIRRLVLTLSGSDRFSEDEKDLLLDALIQ